MADPVRPLVIIAGGQAVAGLLFTLAVAVSAARSGIGAGMAVAEIATWAIVVAGLALVWLGLARRRLVARTPFLLVQAFALVTAWPFVSSDLAAYRFLGLLLAASAAGGLVLALRPGVRGVLG
ncbi:MAG: hypothetical protein WCF04_12205 [Candidatus Nanopelagicales bacterium]